MNANCRLLTTTGAYVYYTQQATKGVALRKAATGL